MASLSLPSRRVGASDGSLPFLYAVAASAASSSGSCSEKVWVVLGGGVAGRGVLAGDSASVSVVFGEAEVVEDGELLFFGGEESTFALRRRNKRLKEELRVGIALLWEWTVGALANGSARRGAVGAARPRS